MSRPIPARSDAEGRDDAVVPGAPRDQRRGAILVATAALMWASMGLVSPWFFERGVTASGVAFWRAVAAASAFALHATVRGVWPRSRASIRWLAAFGVVGVGLFYWSLQAAIETGGISLAWLLLYTAPAWVAVGSPFVLGERIDPRTAGLVVLTIVGVAMVAIGGGEGLRITPVSIAWGLTAGLTYATWYFVTQKAGTGPVATGAVAIPVGALALLPLASWPGVRLVALLLVFGLATSYLPALAYYAGMQHLPAARASIIATIEPVAALAFAWLVYDERLGVLAVVGAGAVLGAALVASLKRS